MATNPQLSTELQEAIETVAEKLEFISENWHESLNACYPFGLDLQEVVARIHDWGMAVDGEFRGDVSLLTTVGKILVEFKADARYLIYSSDEYDYTAENVIEYLTPLLNSEKCSFDVTYADNSRVAVLSVY